MYDVLKFWFICWLQSNGWTAVPQFGEWDQKGGASPNYSMVFGQARANRKEFKKNVKHLSLGNESELAAPPSHNRGGRHQDDAIVVTNLAYLLSNHSFSNISFIACLHIHPSILYRSISPLLNARGSI